jgi:aminoglycoside phosphotransferase (APT) family kinase protein
VLVDVLARLHRLDYRGLGLGGFGRPEGYLERQVRRWSQQWERSKVGDVPEIDALVERLRSALPSAGPAVLVHGDYRLGNVALEPLDPGSIAAVFDWEMATLGDPLADLGYLLIYWGEARDGRDSPSLPGYRDVTAKPGFLTRAELVEAYARRTSFDVSSIDFYQVLAMYKLAVISEGIYARWRMGKTVGEGFDTVERSSVQLARSALGLADSSPLRALRSA